jgi:hypothetical protein
VRHIENGSTDREWLNRAIPYQSPVSDAVESENSAMIDHNERIGKVLHSVTAWVQGRDDIRAVALVGSQARGAARPNLPSLLTGAEFVGARACSGFTECVWTTPEEAAKEMRDAGFDLLDEAGAEGFAGRLRREIEALAQSNPAAFTHAIAFGVQTSKLSQYRRATDHLLLVGRSRQ